MLSGSERVELDAVAVRIRHLHPYEAPVVLPLGLLHAGRVEARPRRANLVAAGQAEPKWLVRGRSAGASPVDSASTDPASSPRMNRWSSA